MLLMNRLKFLKSTVFKNSQNRSIFLMQMFDNTSAIKVNRVFNLQIKYVTIKKKNSRDKNLAYIFLKVKLYKKKKRHLDMTFLQ